MYKGTIDRIEDGNIAVILVENTDENKQVCVDADQLPSELREAGTIMKFDETEDGITNITHLEEEQNERERRIQEKFDRLSSRHQDDS